MVQYRSYIAVYITHGAVYILEVAAMCEKVKNQDYFSLLADLHTFLLPFVKGALCQNCGGETQLASFLSVVITH